MRRPKLEVADVVKEHAEAYALAHPLSPLQKKVLHDIATCRTVDKGGHIDRCNRCGYETISYNSCRNRHCPKCQGAVQNQWLADREKELLPVEYFHVIFSVPKEIGRIAYQNKKVVYGLLFKASWETLRQIADDSKYMGAEIGALAILHTWGQNLEHHPHIHFVIPGGGISKDRSQWISCRPGFFLPVKKLSRLFRGKLLHYIKKAFRQGELSFHGNIDHLDNEKAFHAYLSPLYDDDWFVFCRPPFGNSALVLKYLSRYTHRVAISNYRLVDMKDGKVSFRWKDYAHGCKSRTLTLTTDEFLRRFLLHILPNGFVRIRHFGFLAHRCRNKKLSLCRRLLDTAVFDETKQNALDKDQICSTCPRCKKGEMVTVSNFGPAVNFPLHIGMGPLNDTS